MKPTEILSQEHRVIEQVLDCLEKIVRKSKEEGKVDAESARAAIDFFRGFADKCHHAKEENQLFPVLHTKGFGGGCGPIAVMLREHELGRLYIGGMDASLNAAASGDADAVRWFVQHGESYIRLLREHIQKEDHCLFPSADQKLSTEDEQSLLAAFAQVEKDEIGELHARYVEIANRLAERFGVRRVSEANGELR
ncbi:MAG: hemerythrin domain-containing protein [Thermogutta sp.]|uniref:hemerythrin domain-containing protein n=1 Tax=Thermogutta sp. TaxID=1962930 RepID=UPI0019BEFD65|nr:hemerythrin domain-containing protein [Thermogutta sp.]MBC7351246.1 hemerythrin domain-containing protein [Thermogutta sp.]